MLNVFDRTYFLVLDFKLTQSIFLRVINVYSDKTDPQPVWLFIFLRLSSRQKLSNFVELLADSDTVNGTRRAMAFQKILAFIGIILLVRYFSGSTYYTRLVIYSLYLPQKRFVLTIRKRSKRWILKNSKLKSFSFKRKQFRIHCNYPVNWI